MCLKVKFSKDPIWMNELNMSNFNSILSQENHNRGRRRPSANNTLVFYVRFEYVSTRCAWGELGEFQGIIGVGWTILLNLCDSLSKPFINSNIRALETGETSGRERKSSFTSNFPGFEGLDEAHLYSGVMVIVREADWVKDDKEGDDEKR